MPDAAPVPTITPEKLAQLTGFSVADLGKLARRGYFPAARAGLYRQNEAIPGCFKAYQERTKDDGGTGALPLYQSMAQCSAQTGIPLTVIKAARRKSPETFRQHRILLGPLLQWIFGRNGDNQDWGDSLKKFQALREEIRLEEDRLRVVDRSEVQESLAKATALLFAAIEREFAVQLPPALKGLSESDIQRKMLEAAEGFKHIMRTEFAKYATTTSSQDR